MSRLYRYAKDFEQWRRMAVENPARFEALRSELIEEQIASASSRCQRRLRGLQWRVDQLRAKSPTPMAACITLSSMMWDAFAGEEGLVETLSSQRAPAGQVQSKADLLTFPDNRSE